MTTHLYLRRTPLSTSLTVIRHAFPDGGAAPTRTKEIIERAAVPDWLAAQLQDDSVKAIYACHGCAVSQPEGNVVPWFALPAGHPCERM